MNNNTLLAIPSMDAYNRDADPGLIVNAGSIGDATVGDSFVRPIAFVSCSGGA